MLQDGDYAGAEKGFKTFVQKNPQHPLADAAALWLVHYYASGEVAWRERKETKFDVRLATAINGDEDAVSSGKKAGFTPTGDFTIMQKDPNHRSNIYGNFVDSRGRVVRAGVSARIDSAPSGTHYEGAPMFYFMRLTSEGVGMHIGILPGYPASHGCIRMPAEIAPLIYAHVKIGTLVQVVN